MRSSQPSSQSLLQGDHLGVEFALSANPGLLADAGLLPETKLQSGAMLHSLLDDYFTLSVIVNCKSQPYDALSASNSLKASEQYEKRKVLGSLA